MNKELLNYYRTLRQYRWVVVEPIRTLAFQNMDHLERVHQQFSEATTRSTNLHIEATENKVLEEQGLPQTPLNRWALKLTTDAIWDTYACLLSALLERYEEFTQANPSSRHEPLDSYCRTHRDLLDGLKAIRNKLLHPLNATPFPPYSAFDQSLTSLERSPTHALVELQVALDKYLLRLREQLRQEWTSEVKGAPSTTSRSKQGHWRLASEELSLTVPGASYVKIEGAMQLPIMEATAHHMHRLCPGSRLGPIALQLPPSIFRHRQAILNMLLHSMVMANMASIILIEFMNAKVKDRHIDKVINSQDEPMEAALQKLAEATIKRPEVTLAEIEESMQVGTLFEVRNALLAEPMRIYRMLAGQQEEWRIPVLEKKYDEMRLDLSRNTIFHVPRNDGKITEALTVEAATTPRESNYVEMVEGLGAFFR
ncbi:MAG: hypothetical protein OXG65_16970 [Chloroflexi bacterium]|nr:hypothetical protein [Chloroflexota bacterium]